MKNSLFVFIATFIFLSISANAQSKPKKDTIGDIPLQWEVDLYQELKTNFPKLEKETVYFIGVETHRVLFGNEKRKKDKKTGKFSNPYESTNRTLTVKSVDTAKSKSFIPKATAAKPGDIVTLDYNQQLKVYVPSVDKFVWIQPKKTAIRVLPVLEPKPEDAAIAKAIKSGQQLSAPASAGSDNAIDADPDPVGTSN